MGAFFRYHNEIRYIGENLRHIFSCLKPYIGYILIIVSLVVGISLSTLFLPDRMSKIIGEGISSEMVYERTDNGELIYLNVQEGAEMPLPKLKYENAGKLVTKVIGSKNYAIFTDEIELTPQGEPRSFINPISGQAMVIPKFLRTVDGTENTPQKQGSLVLDKDGVIQLVFEQKSNLNIIWKNGLIMLAITLFSSILSIILSFLSSKVGSGFGRDVRQQIFSKVINLSKSQEDSFSTASLITRTTNDVTQLQMVTIMALRMMINVPVMFVGGLIMAMSKDAKMTIVLLVSIPIISVIILLIARKVVPLFKSIQKRVDHLTMVSRENITGVRVIRAFGGEKHEDKRFADANLGVTEVSLKAARYMSILMPVVTMIMSLTAVAIMFIATFNIDKALQQNALNYTQIGNMMAVIQYIMQIMFSVIMFSIIFIMLPRASVSATRINEVLQTKVSIFNPEHPKQPIRKGDIDFKNVNFSYSKSSNKNVLNDISFSAKRGTTTAIIGGTGSGKSTLINLIPRLYDVTAGKVMVDGVDVREFDIQDLRTRIAFVTQKAVLFEGNIKENILYGAENDRRLESAIDIAQARNLVEEKEGGLDAVVEQGGRNFSGGQKQRLSIARALATDADIIILDDSFSALDFTTDALLRKELERIVKDKTVIIVAQRIGTVMDADNIIVLDSGKIVGMGGHNELLDQCQEYRDIALSQLSEKELGLLGGISD